MRVVRVCFWINCCIRSVCGVRVDECSTRRKVPSFTPFPGRGLRSLSAGVCLCFHNLPTCSLYPRISFLCVCFSGTSKLAVAWEELLSVAWLQRAFYVHWLVFFRGVVTDRECSNTSQPWLAEEGGKTPVIGPNSSDTLVVLFFPSMQSVYIKSELRSSWLPLSERQER